MKDFRQEILKLAKKRDISKMSFREIMREIGAKNPQNRYIPFRKAERQGVVTCGYKRATKSIKTKSFCCG